MASRSTIAGASFFVTALNIAMCLLAGFAMSEEEKSDLSVKVFAAAKVDLVTRLVAEKLSEMLIEAHYGRDELSKQIPLSVKDGGSVWIVSGNRHLGEYAPQTGYLDYGPIQIKITKSDCRILLFVRDAAIATKK